MWGWGTSTGGGKWVVGMQHPAQVAPSTAPLGMPLLLMTVANQLFATEEYLLPMAHMTYGQTSVR